MNLTTSEQPYNGASALTLSSRNRNPQVRFSERYHLGLGADVTESDYWQLGNAIRAMNGGYDSCKFDLDGTDISAAWLPQFHNETDIQYRLYRLYNLISHSVGVPTFRPHHYRKQRDLEKQRREARSQYLVNAWFDVEYGVFWTWENINLKDLATNFAKSVAWMDLTPEERRAENLRHRGRPTLEAQLGPLREQLLARGQKSRP